MEAQPTDTQSRGKSIEVPVYEAEEAVKRLLLHLGEDPARDGLLDTPSRVVKALREMTAGYAVDPAKLLSKQFEAEHDEMIVVKDMPFVSMCEHHLMPFRGTAAIGYLPGAKIVGLSKFARLLDCFACRFQVQERLTDQIATAIMEHTDARGAGCIVRSSHGCMTCRGIKKHGKMVTSAMKGMFLEVPATKAEFLSHVRS